jgi:hypothetical protein
VEAGEAKLRMIFARSHGGLARSHGGSARNGGGFARGGGSGRAADLSAVENASGIAGS